MTEQSTLLKQAYRAIRELEVRLDRADRRNREPVAVIGLGCRYPGGVVNDETLWSLLREGRDAVRTVPADRWCAEDYFDPNPGIPGKMVTCKGGFLDHFDQFDARFFEIAPREATSMDPQQRLALEVAWEALENAACSPASLRGTKTGVFLGIASNDFNQLATRTSDVESLDIHYATGISHSVASGRISYFLGLEGPSVSLDTACSSSLVSVHLACQALRSGDCSLALAGGINLLLDPETIASLSRLRMLSPTGSCKTFDEAADGFVPGEGCGFVVLKTLTEAQKDGDRIIAVIRGTAVNQDGASSSLTAPNGPSQVGLMRQALSNAGMGAAEVSYIEAHGTGTPLGDPIELRALGVVYGTTRPVDKPLIVGSIKSNFGHLEAGAGIAGLIKAILAIEHRQIPPSLHLKHPTPHVPWPDLRLTVPTQLTDWRTDGVPLAAGVSSFGFSGTNAHIVLGEAAPATEARKEKHWPAQILAISAKSASALRQVASRYHEFLEKHPRTDLRDFCFTANTGRSHFPFRAGWIVEDMASAKRALAELVSSAETIREAAEAARLGFLFTGQGSQYAGMGRELYESAPVFRKAIERLATVWKEETGEDLIGVLYGIESEERTEPEERTGSGELKEARQAQPALYAVEFALAELWRSWGIEPSVVLGHSLGEYVAAAVAGIFSPEDGLRLVCARARLMDTLTRPGAMRSIAASAERVEKEIQGLEQEVSIAVINGPENVVLSGRKETVERVAAKFEAEGVRTRALDVTHAFHSPELDSILDEFERCAEKVKYQEPKIRVISNRTGRAAQSGEMSRARYWRGQMRSTVRFAEGLEAALQTGAKTFVEIGPQPHLLTLAKSAHRDSALRWIPSMRKGRNPWMELLEGVLILYVQGWEINWKALHGRSGRPIVLPTYPFERERYWFQKKLNTASASAASFRVSGHPLLGDRLCSPLAEIQFESKIGPDTDLAFHRIAYLSDHKVAGHRTVPAAAYLEMALSAARLTGQDRAEPWSVRSAVFSRPCVFDEPRVLQCVLTGSDAGRTFTIYSRPDGAGADNSEGNAWLLHSTGEVALGTHNGTADYNLRPEGRVALDAIRAKCTDRTSGSDFYRAFEAGGAQFGPSFRPVVRVYRGTREVLVDLEIPSSVTDESGQYQVHPATLDACFHAAVALLSTIGKDSGSIYLPGAIESLQLLGDPRSLTVAHAWIHGKDVFTEGKPLTVDLRGLDQFGNVILLADGLVMRPTARLDDRTATGPDFTASPFYEIDWVPMQVDPDSQKQKIAFDPSRLTVVAGDGAMASAFSKVLGQELVQSVCLPRLDPSIAKEGDEEDRLRALQSAFDKDVSDCVFFAATDAGSTIKLLPNQQLEQQSKVLGECLSTVQALLGTNPNLTSRIWIVTRGAQGPQLSNVAGSTLWGFGRSIAAEFPEMQVIRMDLDPRREWSAKELLERMRTAGSEDELALHGGETYVPRLRPFVPRRIESSNAQHTSFSGGANLRLELTRAGSIEGLQIVSVLRAEPGPGQVEIRVGAAGVNFRDVLTALGMYPAPPGPIGGECAGTVVRVGSSVSAFKPGDEVVAVGPACFAEFMTASAEMVWKKPANLSFAAAVTVPVAFLTAWYALHRLAKIQPGESVLIHSGAGGVGLAAIQVARQAGAVVFATAGSEEKRSYLCSMGVPHVMDSRSLAFADEIREQTGGRGVDIVLNSLAGAAIDAGLSSLAPNGRFLEMGVTDIRSAESVAQIYPSVAYHAFNLAPALVARDPLVREVLSTVFDEVECGRLEPLPRNIFSLENAQDAFRFMAQARHIGRVVLVPSSANSEKGIRRDGAYLVTGGLSGIGLEVAEWLAQQGAGRVIMMGRHAANADAGERIERMRALGTGVRVAQGDVAHEADVAAALAQAEEFPLRGVFHCAGVLDDGVLLRQDWQRFENVLAPKLLGASHLHTLTLDRPLDHFVLFSSVASVLGSAGQANYAAANAYLDGMATYRHSLGLPALSVNWGAWSETGMAVRSGLAVRRSNLGLDGFSNKEGLAALEKLMKGDRAQAVAARMDWKKYFVGTALHPALLRELEADRTVTPAQKSPQAVTSSRHSKPASASWLQQIDAATPPRRESVLLHLLEARVRDILGLRGSDDIRPDQPLQELGLDSLLSIELRNSVSASIESNLPATLLFNYPTLETLARFLLRDVIQPPTNERRTSLSEPMPDTSRDLIDDVASLSDEEVERQLSLRGAGDTA